MSNSAKIGIFDSGVGGLSLVKELYDQNADISISYLEDSEFFPYGDKSEEAIYQRVKKISNFFINKKIYNIAIACNTATNVAIKKIRSEFKYVTFFGIEPGVKPAIMESNKKSILVIATPNTLKSQKYHNLKKQFTSECKIIDLALPNLAEKIERNPTNWEQKIVAEINLLDNERKKEDIDVLVLACTHYHLIMTYLDQMLSNTTIYSPIDSLANHIMSSLNISQTNKQPSSSFFTTKSNIHFLEWAKKISSKKGANPITIELTSLETSSQMLSK